MATFGVITPEQREAAMAKAKETRAERSGYLQEIRDGKTTAAEVLALKPGGDRREELLRSIQVATFLRAVPRVGPKKLEKILAEAAIKPGTRVRNLTNLQRQTILAHLS